MISGMSICRYARDALVLLLGLSGCSGGHGSSDGGVVDLGAPDLIPACTSDGKPAALAARYGLRLDLAITARVPAGCEDNGCILDSDTSARLLLLASVEQQGRDLHFTLQPCQEALPTVALDGRGGQPPTVLTAPDALLQSLRPVSGAATLDGDATCSRFALGPLALVLGARLADPLTDPLPSYSKKATPPVPLCDGRASSDCYPSADAGAADTGCVCDQDHDGMPGATVGASGVPALSDVDQIDLANRTVFTLSGLALPVAAGETASRLHGTLAGLRLDQSPVGCHHGAATPYKCTTDETDSVARLSPGLTQSAFTASNFLAVPVAADATCSTLIAQAKTLFQEP